MGSAQMRVPARTSKTRVEVVPDAAASATAAVAPTLDVEITGIPLTETFFRARFTVDNRQVRAVTL
jgi:hypothetical protein